jgi:hypothetical protein
MNHLLPAFTFTPEGFKTSDCRNLSSGFNILFHDAITCGWVEPENFSNYDLINSKYK